jgi:uncharacterized protein (TIGR03663 family)
MSSGSRETGLRSPLESLRLDRTLQAVLVVVVLATVARLAFLGQRVAHQDEARVGYWILRFFVTDRFEYRPIVHGPFLFVVNRHVFGLLGPGDFAARLVVALIGSALPLASLLFRHRLRRGETVALALFLAFNPVLLYYSRFMRVDLPLAAFMLFTVGFWVRAYDSCGRRRAGYFLAGATSFGLAFTTKENAILYPVCWAGALVLLFDHRLFRAWARGQSPVDAASDAFKSVLPTRESVRATADRHDLTPGSLFACAAAVTLAGLGLWLAIVVFFYAPRGGGYPPPTGTAEGIGLWMALGSLDVGMLWAVVVDATYGTWQSFYGEWITGGHQDHAYLPFLGAFVKTMGSGALVLSLSAVAGLIVDRYSRDGPRDLVAAAGYWGIASAFGYPLATDIAAPWTTIHAIVPLAIPAAVGVGLLYRTARRSLAEDDRVSVGITTVVAVLMVGLVAVPAASGVYLNPQSPDNEMVQYAQSSSTDLEPVLEDARQVGADNDGTDVIFYGDEWYSPDESEHDLATAGRGWFERLPLMWYFEVYEYRMANDGDPDTEFVVASTRDERVVANQTPPVVVAFADVDQGSIAEDEKDVAPFLEGYDRWQGHRFLYDTGVQSSIVVFVDTDRLDDPAGSYDGRPGGSGRIRPVPAT